jgi:hypothetical protein
VLGGATAPSRIQKLAPALARMLGPRRVPSLPRFLAGLFLSACLGGGLVLALAPAGCGSDAVGIDACRQIEDARCQASTACGYTADQVDACNLFYRDQCLAGVENADAGTPADTTVSACVAAIQAAGACAKAGAKTIDGCAGAKLLDGADHTRTPCELIQAHVEDLAACAFVTMPVSDAGVIDASDAGDASDGG